MLGFLIVFSQLSCWNKSDDIESFTRKHWHSSSGSTLCSHSKIVQEEKDCLSVFFSTFTVLQSITVTKTQLISYRNKNQCSNLISNSSSFSVHREITKTCFYQRAFSWHRPQNNISSLLCVTVMPVVHLHGVKVGTGFIQQQDSGPTEDGSSQTHQLLVAIAQHMSSIFQLKIQLIWKLLNHWFKPHLKKNTY